MERREMWSVRSGIRRWAALAVALLVSSLAGGAESAASAPELKDLESVEELQARFNRDRGAPRLVLLLSPT